MPFLVTPPVSHLIVCSRSLSMRIYALIFAGDAPISQDPVLLKTLRPHSSPVITTATDQSGTLAATGSADGTIKVWDIRGGYTTHTFRGHTGVISALHFFEKADHVKGYALANKSRKAKYAHQESTGDIDKARSSTTNAGDDSPNLHVASGSEDGKIKVWSLAKRKPVANLDSHVSVVRGIDFTSKSNVLVTASRDKTVILWDSQTWKPVRVIPILESVEAVGFLKNDNIIYTGGESGVTRVWERLGGRELTNGQGAGNDNNRIVDVLYCPEMEFVLSVHADQTLVLQSTADLETMTLLKGGISPLPVLRRISGTHDEIIDMAYITQKRSLLALATNSESVRIVDLSTKSSLQDSSRSGTYFGADVAALKGHEDIVICLDVDWSGCWLATGAKDNTARLWSIDHKHGSYRCVMTFTGHAESLGAISLPQNPPPAGSAAYKEPLAHPPLFLLSGSQDRTVKKWEIGETSASISSKNSSRALYTRKAHDKDINAIATNHSSNLFASASQDRTVKIWSVKEGEVLGILRGHRRGVWSVRFAPKETPSMTGEKGPASASRGLVLTGSGDKTVKIWSLTDYSCLRTLEGHSNSVLKILWMPINEVSRPSNSASRRPLQIASAGGDGLVKVWDANTGEVSCTLDNHVDRVWALTSNPETGMLVSGGGDSVVTFWKDTTSTTIAATAAASTQRVEQEQQLQNYIHSGSYRQAIVLALELNHPARLLTLLQNVTATNPPEEESLSGSKAVDEILGDLSDGQLLILMQRLRDWNTNARTAVVAQRILGVVVRSYPTQRLAALRGRGWKEALDALKVYTERHYKRIEDLVDESYLVEYTLGEMEEVMGTDFGTSELTNGQPDVIMV